MEPTFSWYTTVPNIKPLEQGDLLNRFPVINLPASLTERPAEMEVISQSFNVVVMTQSCDIVKFSDEDSVILCPRYSLSEAKTRTGKTLNNKDGWNKLRKGSYVSLHLINKCSLINHEFEYQVIDLQRIFTVPLSLVKQVAVNQGERVRLLPPYREHLAQAFTRQFMRVGLPIDLPQEFPLSR